MRFGLNDVKILRWPEPTYMRASYVFVCVFQNERFNRFL